MTFLANNVLNKSYTYFDWNVDSQDAIGNIGSQKIYQNVTQNLSKTKSNHVLMHDTKAQSALALKDIIRYAKEHGYHFEVITRDTKPYRHTPNN